MGHKLTWLFDDPRAADVPEDEQLEKFREVRDQIERKILYWLDHQDAELAKLREQRERERQLRLRTAQIETANCEAFAVLGETDECTKVSLSRPVALPA